MIAISVVRPQGWGGADLYDVDAVLDHEILLSLIRIWSIEIYQKLSASMSVENLKVP